jgi:ubiquinone/menaquinone biosynthesis C-methylase UbiE
MTEELRGPDPALINQRYDTLLYSRHLNDFAEGWGNFGYWTPTTRSQREASENLMQQLLACIPVKKGLVLDVACGKGMTTKYLTRHYRPEQLTGVNISEKQISTARELVPGASFEVMDAAKMSFGDASFDDVICVEAAFHFDTREAFFREAFRVLKPGGHLVLADVLLTREGARRRLVCTEKNHLENPDEHAALLRRVGFEQVEVTDVTEECWHRHYRHVVQYAHEKFLARQIELEEMQRLLKATYERVPDLSYYLLAAARKPATRG